MSTALECIAGPTPESIVAMAAYWCDCTAATELDSFDEETRGLILDDLEGEFDILLPDEALQGCRTVGDLAALVVRMAEANQK